MNKARTRLISCYNCPVACGATISMPGLPTYMMKCFTKLTYTMAAMSNLDFGLKIAQKATEYGVDGFTTPQVMAFALELYENGILTDDDFPGMPADNEGRFYWLLDCIVRREGIGDIYLAYTQSFEARDPGAYGFDAAVEFLRRAGISASVHIGIEKHIPVAAGLGGGSSNAAATLWGLNRLLGRPCGAAELYRLAAAVGSDVPFFLDPRLDRLSDHPAIHVDFTWKRLR